MSQVLESISNLSFYGFYDPSKNMVVVHFFNEEELKSDIIAFLNRNMTWDVREILDETSTLDDNAEYIVINHKKLEECVKGGDFDIFIRDGLVKMSRLLNTKDQKNTNMDKVLSILSNNSYDN